MVGGGREIGDFHPLGIEERLRSRIEFTCQFDSDTATSEDSSIELLQTLNGTRGRSQIDGGGSLLEIDGDVGFEVDHGHDGFANIRFSELIVQIGDDNSCLAVSTTAFYFLLDFESLEVFFGSFHLF